MASFTDEIQKFNPYIEQLPVDDYVKVGMMAQGQYNAGLQTVQGAIDQISGLPVIREVDKQYVRSALTKLQEQVKSVGASDFRNQQLITQITGAARMIGRDKNVQAAVSSAAFIQKEQELMEKQRIEGKSSPENEWDWMNEYQKYLSSPQLGQQFSYKYTPYRDVKKKVLDVLKQINPDAKISDNIFGADGQISDVMLREQFKGVDPGKIKQAVLAALDEGDMKQLSISGRYSMANYGADRLTQVSSAAIARQRAIIDAKKKQLENTKAGVSDVQEQLNIQKKIDALDKEAESLNTEETFYSSRIKAGRLDEVRAQLYSQQFLNQFGNAFSYTELSQTYQNNPAAEMALQRAKMEQDWEKFKLDYEQDERHHAEDIEQKEKDREASDKANGNYGALPLPINVSDLPEVNLGGFKGKIEEMDKQGQGMENDFLQMQGKDKNWLNQMRILYDQGKAIDPLVKDYFQRREALDKELATNKALILQLERDADKNVGSLTKVLGEMPGLSIKGKTGETVYTAAELVAVNNIWNKITYSRPSDKLTSKSGPVMITDYDMAKAKQLASPKEYALLQIWHKHANGNMTADEKDVYNESVKIVQKAFPIASDLSKKRSNYINQELAVRTGETQRIDIPLPTNKTEQRQQLRNRVDAFISRAEDQGSFGTEGTRVSSIKELRQWNADENTTYHLITKGKTQYAPEKYWVRLQNPDGKHKDIPISAEDKKYVFGNMGDGKDNPQADPVENTIRATNNRTTNFNGISDPVKSFPTAYFGKTDFPKVQNFSIRGDIAVQSGRQALVLYVYEPESKTYIKHVYAPPNGLMDKNQTLQTVSQLTDEVLVQLIYPKDQTDTPEKIKKKLEQIKALNTKALN